MKKYDVTALGELLIDFTESGTSVQGNPLLEVNPGGAPCNVLAMLNKLGKSTAFIGKIGKDLFGDLLRSTLYDIGIDTVNLVTDKAYNTTLAFVHTLPDGDRRFSFYRNPGADMMLSVDDVNIDVIKNSRIFHFGTLSSTHPCCREATRYSIDTALKNYITLSFDPNLRENLWDSLDNAKQEILYGLSKCNILKISDYELEFITGNCYDYDVAMSSLLNKYKNIKIAFLTCGKNGAAVYYKGMCMKAETFSQIKAIDTTGAGDTFTGCILSYILEHDINNLTADNLREMLIFANAGASLITAKKGAIKSMPERKEIDALIKEY